MEEEGDVDIGAMSWRPPASADAAAKSGAEVDDPVEKDRLVKEVVSLQEGLKGLLDRVDTVGAEVDKKRADNAMLQTYINNLTRQNALIGPK